jgi:membrane protein
MTSRLPPLGLRAGLHFLERVARRFVADRCTRAAAELAFATALAIVPLVAVVVLLFSSFPAFGALVEEARQFVFRHFVPASGEVVSRYIEQFAENAGRLTVWGIAFLFVAAIMLLATIERAFNDIWHAPPRRRRALLRLLAYWAVITLAPLLVGVGLAVSGYLLSREVFAAGAALGFLRGLLAWGLPVAFEFLGLTLLYTIVPNRPVRLHHALLGAAVAAVLFELAKLGFVFFFTRFATYRLIYGAIAALPVFLIWIYLSWTIVLAGAVLTAELPTISPAAAKSLRPPRSRSQSARRRR